MKIQFESLKEIKEFVLMIDVYQLCDKQEPWKGCGVFIKDRRFDSFLRESDYIITEPSDSRVDHRGHIECIATPYYKQISWLFETLYYFSDYNYNIHAGDKKLDRGVLQSGFPACCAKYFKINPDYTVKELMVFIIDELDRTMKMKYPIKLDYKVNN